MKEKYLNETVGTLGVLFIKLHQYHWYVEGEKFFGLHELFEDYYDEINENLDEYAERMLSLGLKPVSTLKEFLDLSWIDEKPYHKKMDHKEMVRSVYDDFELIARKLQEGIELFEDDDVTADMLIDLKGTLEKHNWMLRAYLV